MKQEILKLVNSIEFQELNSYYNEKTMFSALNVERNENRHSAFIAWWLNPKSEHGLGDAPLKLFLRLITAMTGWSDSTSVGFDETFNSRILAGSYNVVLYEDVEVEKNVGKISNSSSKDRIDIWTVLELSYEEDDKLERRIIPIVVENKIYSNEGKAQTQRYYDIANSYQQEENVPQKPMCVFLTVETQKPSCDKFVNIIYQDLLTYVIEPLMSNVALESAQFVEAFVRNLGRPALAGNKHYGILAVSQKEKAMLEKVASKYKHFFDTAFALLYKNSIVAECDKILDNEKEILRMLWDANDVVFKAIIYHLYENHKKELDNLFKTANRDTSKYIVSYKGEEIFPKKRLSKAMTACAIFKAYLKEHPATTIEELRTTFPCKELNNYYYNRYYNDLFYEHTSDEIIHIGSKEIELTALTQWDFYLNPEQLLPIENGSKEAMCVKMWRKGDFDKLIEFVHKKGYDKFITIEEC